MILLYVLMGVFIVVNGVIIVSPAGEEFCCEDLGAEWHVDILKKYIAEHHMDTQGISQDCYSLACFLALYDHLVATVEGGSYGFYLGDNIFTGQFDWYIKNKKKIRNVYGVVDVSGGKVREYDNYTVSDQTTPSRVLRELIRDRNVGDFNVGKAKSK